MSVYIFDGLCYRRSRGSACKQIGEKSSLITILFSSTSLYYFENSARLKSLCANKSSIRQGQAACWSSEWLLHMLCFQLHTRPSRPRDARCIGGKMTCFTREPEVSSIFSTSSIAGTSLLIHSTDWSLTNFSMRFPHKFLNSLTLNLTEMLIWKENDSVKYGDFPDQSQSFRFFAAHSHQNN